MQELDYVAARSSSEVISLLSQEGERARVLSGGTDLIVQLREGRRTARLLVDIKRVPDANRLVCDPGTGLWLGAAVPCQRIVSDPAVAALYPGLLDAISLIGGTQIQGRASVGGNLCNASPAADSIPALIVHRAICLVSGPGGGREIPAEDFCIAPGRTVLTPGEFLEALRLPPPPSGFGASYLRFIPRNEMDIAVAGVGVSVVLDEARATFVSAHVALSAVAPVPLFVPEAGAWLAGRPVSADTIAGAAVIARAAARPITDMRGTAAQRQHLAGVLTRRALETAVQRARMAV